MTATDTRTVVPRLVRATLLGTAAGTSLHAGALAQTGDRTGTSEADLVEVRAVDGGAVIDALAGDDTIRVLEGVGVDGAGTVFGGDGDDSIRVPYIGRYAGSDGRVFGDAGDDTIEVGDVGSSGFGTVSGGEGDDLIRLPYASYVGANAGGTGQVLGDAGNDTILLGLYASVGDRGAGTVSGGEGDDLISLDEAELGWSTGGTGQVLGDAGNDTILLNDYSSIGSRGAGTVSGGEGDDSIEVEGGYTTFIGRYDGGSGQLLGDDGDDTITIRQGVVGGEGEGTVSGGAGNDSITLTDQTQIASGSGGSGQVTGDAGNDTITLDRASLGLSGGSSTVSGGADDDLIRLVNRTLANGPSAVLGDAGDDTVSLDGTVALGSEARVDGGDGTDVLALFVGEGEAATSETLAGTFANFELFTMDGAGTLDVTGQDFGQDGFDSFSVLGGTVNVTETGSLTATDIRLRGGRLDVQGTVRGDVMATGGVVSGSGAFEGLLVIGDGATLAPSLGPGDAISTISIDGGLRLEDGSTTIVEVAPGGADALDVTGAVTVEGGTLILRDFNGLTPADDIGASIVIIANDGTDAVMGGGFAAVQDELAFLDPFLSLTGGDGNDVAVSFVMPVVLDLAGAARTPNQAAAGVAFADVLESGEDGDDRSADRQAFFDAFVPLIETQAAAALDGLSGVVHSAAQYEAGRTSLFLGREAMAGHGAGGGEDGRFRVFSRLAYRDASVDTDPRGAAGHDAAAFGIMAGVDKQVADGVTLGASFAVFGAETDVGRGLGEAEQDGFAVAGTALAERGAVSAGFTLGHAFGEVATDRGVRIGTLSERLDASYDTDTTYALGTVRYAARARGVSVEPFVGGGVALARRGAFAERGGSLAALSGEENDETYGYGTLGVRIAGAASSAALQPYASVAYERLIGEVTPDAVFAFEAGPAFSIAAANHDRDVARLGWGLSAEIGEGGTAFVGYEGAFSGSDDVHSARVGVRIGF